MEWMQCVLTHEGPSINYAGKILGICYPASLLPSLSHPPFPRPDVRFLYIKSLIKCELQRRLFEPGADLMNERALT